jgi:hypothetical protein
VFFVVEKTLRPRVRGDERISQIAPADLIAAISAWL